MSLKHSLQRSIRGFSLVEVTLALGILAFVILPVMGMLTAGLERQHSANMDTAKSQISQKLSSRYLATEFSTLQQISTPEMSYFTGEGEEVSAGDSHALYSTKVTVRYPLAVPTSTGSYVSNYNAAGLLIQVAHNPGQISDPFSAPALSRSSSFTVVYRNDTH